MSYDELTYWRGRPNPTSEDEIYLQSNLDFLTRNINPGETVLEFGPGIGRTLPIYTLVPVKSVHFCDISNVYYDRLLQACMMFNIPFSGFDLLNHVGSLYYPSKEFDVVIASQVLLHQRPINIIPVMSELARVGKRVVVITWWNPDTKCNTPGVEGEWPTGQFHYDYEQICSSQGWYIDHIARFKDQSYFVYYE